MCDLLEKTINRTQDETISSNQIMNEEENSTRNQNNDLANNTSESICYDNVRSPSICEIEVTDDSFFDSKANKLQTHLESVLYNENNILHDTSNCKFCTEPIDLSFTEEDSSDNFVEDSCKCKSGLRIENHKYNFEAIYFYTGLESYEKFLFVFQH